MKTMKSTEILFLFVLSFLAASCGEHYRTYYNDEPVAETPSLWCTNGHFYRGESFEDARADDTPGSDAMYYYILFEEDGNGKIITLDKWHSNIENLVDVKPMTYTTKDNCHFDILCNGRKINLTFAKKSYSYDNTVYNFVYSDSVVGGKKFYTFNHVEEERNDSSLYLQAPELRGVVSVPQNRVWRSRTLSGVFDSVYNGLYCQFDKSGKFATWSDLDDTRHRGKYEVKDENGIQILYLHYDGKSEANQIVIVDDTRFMLYTGGQLLDIYCRL